MDESKYYALVLSVAMEASPPLREAAMTKLVAAVESDVEDRGACRDTDSWAATRVRLWA